MPRWLQQLGEEREAASVLEEMPLWEEPLECEALHDVEEGLQEPRPEQALCWKDSKSLSDRHGKVPSRWNQPQALPGQLSREEWPVSFWQLQAPVVEPPLRRPDGPVGVIGSGLPQILPDHVFWEGPQPAEAELECR